MKFDATFDSGENLEANFETSEGMDADFGSHIRTATGNYNDLSNKPSIENVTLEGNKTIKQIGVGTLTVQEIEKILYLN